jgi:transposase
VKDTNEVIPGKKAGFKKGTRGKISAYTLEQRNEFARQIHDKEMSQAELADKLGVTRQAVSLWVKSYRVNVLGLKLPKRKNVKKKRFPTREELFNYQWELRTRRPSQLGIDGGANNVWNEKSVGAYLTKKLGEKYTPTFIWRFIEDYLIFEEPDDWAIKERREWEKKGNSGPPPFEQPGEARPDEAGDEGEDLGVKKRKRGRPKKGEEVGDIQTMTSDDVELMEKEIAEVRAKMIADYQEGASLGLAPLPAPGKRVGKNRKATKSRHTKPKRKRKKKR